MGVSAQKVFNKSRASCKCLNSLQSLSLVPHESECVGRCCVADEFAEASQSLTRVSLGSNVLFCKSVVFISPTVNCSWAISVNRWPPRARPPCSDPCQLSRTWSTMMPEFPRPSSSSGSDRRLWPWPSFFLKRLAQTIFLTV